MKNRKKGPPEDKTPKFEFYLYNDAGRIIKQYLSIHEIQQILLQQSQNLGDKSCLGDPAKYSEIYVFRAPTACLADREKRNELETNRAAEEDAADNTNNTQDSPDHGHKLDWQ